MGLCYRSPDRLIQGAPVFVEHLDVTQLVEIVGVKLVELE